MPRQPIVTEIGLANITACLTPALTLLNERNDTFGPIHYSAHFKHCFLINGHGTGDCSELPHSQGSNIVMNAIERETEQK
jgi:hypothetical protein